MKRIATLAILAVMPLAAAACGGNRTPENNAYHRIDQHAQARTPYIPKNDVEFNNYNAAQRLYDSPDTIIWCSTTWGNASAPLVTVPVTGKLTSSSTTFFNPERMRDLSGDGINDTVPSGPARSVDGLFHPNPPQYRYGFTPGGQYVDFFNMPTFCTTALTKFQRQGTKVTVSFDQQAQVAQRKAEAALRHGDKAGAAKALEALGG
jgi:hypothetical protein